MKKKIIISIIAIMLSALLGIGLGYLTSGNKNTTIENPSTLTYYVDVEQTESFSIDMPTEYVKKIYVDLSTPVDGLQRYAFVHESTQEILFVIFISEGDAYKNLTGNYEIIKETEKYKYIWTQSVVVNEFIMDSELKQDFENIAKYYEAIKESFKTN